MYRLGLGAFLTLGVNVPEIDSARGKVSALINFGLGTDFMVSFGSALEEQYVAFNIVALILLVSLLRNRPARMDKI